MSDDKIKSKNYSYATVKFHVSDNMLKASFTNNTIETPLNNDSCNEILKDNGFEKHHLNEDLIKNIIELSENNYQGEIDVEEHYDASFEVKIDNKNMSAKLNIKQARGGESLNCDDVFESILELSLYEDFLDKELISECINSIKDETPVIAEGIPAINGKDSEFEVLFHGDRKHAPTEEFNGSVDHYKTMEYITVEENQQLMGKSPRTDGKAGRDIFGEKILPVKGNEIPFVLDDSVRIDPNDPNVLLAAKKGHPLVIENGVKVDDTLILDNADLDSGDIDFDGSVQILGEVKPNVEINASGDIFVNGMVENASLIAGHNITIKGGIYKNIVHDDDEQEHQCENMLEANGEIIANYCNGICVSAKKDILIENYSMHCCLHSDQSIIVGVNNGKGVLIGGHTHAGHNITATTVGSDAYVKTEVVCGSLTKIRRQYKKIKYNIKRTRKEQAVLEEILESIKKFGSPISVGNITLNTAKTIFKEIKQVNRNIVQLAGEYSAIKKELKCRKKAHLEVRKILHPNVHIIINDTSVLNKREHGQSKVASIDHEIHYN